MIRRIVKYMGIAILAIAIFCALGIIGRVENEDRRYRCGEITQEQMTTAEELGKQIGICAVCGVVGGACIGIGAYADMGRRWD